MTARALRRAGRALDQLRSQIRRRSLNAQYPSLRIDRSSYIGRGCRIACSDNSRLELRSAHIGPGSIVQADSGGHLIIECSSVGANCVIAAAERITVRPGCSIAEMVVIRDQDHKGTPGREWEPHEFHTGPITIGERAWIGSKATVLKGVTVGADAIVGAGAVVTTDVLPSSIAVGVPAGAIGTRHTPTDVL